MTFKIEHFNSKNKRVGRVDYISAESADDALTKYRNRAAKIRAARKPKSAVLTKITQLHFQISIGGDE